MNRSLHTVFWAILLFAIYHLLRDVATDIFGIHHPLLDFGHRDRYYYGSATTYLPIPAAIATIAACVLILRRKKTGRLGLVVLISLPLWAIAWALS